jgi:predicted AlkP superfamily pyrophosphatase or phosphodiesterase
VASYATIRSMTRFVLAGLVALVLFAGTLRGAEVPRLLVIVVVDQLRADYLDTFDRHWRHGFRTLLDEGFLYERAEYPYLNTVTCAGHATVGTGTLPRTHGMVLNAWWHPDVRRSLGCTEDADTAGVGYGSTVERGHSPTRLLVPTLADELRAQQPGSRVVSLSLKPRSAIGLAGRGGDVVAWFDEASGAFATSKAYAAEPVPVLARFLERHPYDRELVRTWALLDRPETYVMRDAGVGERPPRPWGGLFPHIVEPGEREKDARDAQFISLWQSSPFADEYLGEMAGAMIEALALGQREQTDFLGIAFSTLDLVGHRFGPNSREVEDLLRRLDVTLGTLLEQLDRRVGRDRYVLALTSDHGVAPTAAAEGSGRIVTQDVRERLEETLIEQFGALDEGSYVDAVNFVEVSLRPGLFDRLRSTPSAMRAVERALMGIPGVSRVLRRDELSDTSPDPIVRAAALGYVPDRSGDLFVVPRPYWYMEPRLSTTATTHGTLYSYDARVPVLLFGSHVKVGRTDERVTPADIAPTLARLADIRLATTDGRVLERAIR